MIQSGLFWFVLTASCLVFWLLKPSWRLPFLALASFAFLCSVDTFSTMTLLIGCVAMKLVWDVGDQKESKLIHVQWIVAFLIGWLCMFKALPILFEKLFSDSMFVGFIIPIGVSYYTFKLIHYNVERARGNLAGIDYGEYLCWLFLFPTFTAGPIEQLEHFHKNRSQEFDQDLFIEGLWRIMHGLIKKLVLADIVVREHLMRGHTVPGVLEILDTWPAWQLWVFLIFLYMYFYLEFSAYSDIAIGASRLFGIRIMENFNWPIVAHNISDFWKRWHMTLAGFCQRYVYMPVIARTRNPYLAIYSTFLVMGLWHATNLNYLSWGLYHATGVAVVLTFTRIKRARNWPQRPNGILKYWGIPITFLYVTVSGVFSSTSGLGFDVALRLASALVGL